MPVTIRDRRIPDHKGLGVHVPKELIQSGDFLNEATVRGRLGIRENEAPAGVLD